MLLAGDDGGLGRFFDGEERAAGFGQRQRGWNRRLRHPGFAVDGDSYETKGGHVQHGDAEEQYAAEVVEHPVADALFHLSARRHEGTHRRYLLF